MALWCQYPDGSKLGRCRSKSGRPIDTTLKRDVALRLLPDALGSDPERLARFQREVRLLAALNHPDIAAIYSVHEHQGTQRF